MKLSAPLWTSGLFSEAEVQDLVVARYRTGTCRWFGGGDYPVAGVLDHAVDAGVLLAQVRERAEARGVRFLDRHEVIGERAGAGGVTVALRAVDGGAVHTLSAALLVDAGAMSAFWTAVKAAPVISAVFDKASSMEGFNQRTSRNMGIFSGILTLFAVAMAVGIIYNAARISLSERAWELASLRVLGMTRGEVSVLLLAELGAELLVALPVGALMGWGLATLMMELMASDSIDFPVVIEPSTYASAALIVLAAGLVSALLVRRQIDRLDLVSVLKVRE